jgi:hypothetical protein
MISYLRQVAICESVRKKIIQALAQSDDVTIRLKANHLATNESTLRAVTLFPTLDTEEKLEKFIMEHTLSSLNLTVAQSEQLKLEQSRAEVVDRLTS